MKTILFILAISLMTQYTSAQTSILQDKSGETSLLISNSKALFINAADANATLSMSFNSTKWFVGGTAKIAATNGVATLLDGYKFSPEITLLATGGHYISGPKSTIRFMYYSLKLTNAKYDLLKSDNSNTFNKQHFTGLDLSIGFNQLADNEMPFGTKIVKVLFGGALSYGRTNNIEDLDAVTTFVTDSKTEGGITTTMQKDKSEGYQGEYIAKNSFRLKIDAYVFPDSKDGRIGLGGYLRSQLSGHLPRNNVGLGIVVNQKDLPSNIAFGVLYQFNDVFNQLGKENSFIKRGGINIVAGYNF